MASGHKKNLSKFEFDSKFTNIYKEKGVSATKTVVFVRKNEINTNFYGKNHKIMEVAPREVDKHTRKRKGIMKKHRRRTKG